MKFGGSVRTAGRWAALAGLAVEVSGTFLPWLRSGTALRNSYAAGGVLRRLLGASGALGGLLRAWPALTLLCAATVAAYLLGARRAATLLGALAALAGAAAAVTALVLRAARYPEVVVNGPVVTLIGATVLGLAIILQAVGRPAGVPVHDRPE
jgi:hypothetical protein